MTNFRKWSDLQQFHEVVKSLGHNRLYQVLVANDYKITYGLKIKLHGTNAGIRIEPDGKVVAQKRSSDIPPNSDNAGFRAWVEANESYFSNLAKSNATKVIYGEWAGPGIQSGVAVSAIPSKTFFVFATDTYRDDGETCRFYDPETIEMFLGAEAPNDLIVIPWHDKVTIDFVSKASTEATLAKLNALTEAVGENDPLIEELFNTKGCGEGFVCYPFLGESQGLAYVGNELEHFSHFNFKAKSEHHRVNPSKAAVSFDPEKFASTNRFADGFCTEQRFLQGFKDALGEQIDIKLTGSFVKWICQDIYKESTTEREDSNVDWNAASKACSSRAATWYKNRCNGSTL